MLLLCSFLGSTLLAADQRESKWSLTGKVGGNIQRAEDGENGQSFGMGAGAGFKVNPRWTIEFEVWVPAYMEAQGKEFRDILFGLSGVRSWERGRYQPYLLFGLAPAYVQVRRPSGDTSNNFAYFQTGVGCGIRLSDHISLAPEIRFDLAVSSSVVRPAFGIRFD